jgi:hypothetical protein
MGLLKMLEHISPLFSSASHSFDFVQDCVRGVVKDESEAKQRWFISTTLAACHAAHCELPTGRGNWQHFC